MHVHVLSGEAQDVLPLITIAQKKYIGFTSYTQYERDLRIYIDESPSHDEYPTRPGHRPPAGKIK